MTIPRNETPQYKSALTAMQKFRDEPVKAADAGHRRAQWVGHFALSVAGALAFLGFFLLIAMPSENWPW